MTTLMQQLETELSRAEKVYGADNPYTKSLRTQLEGMKAAGEKSLKQIYHSGRPMDPAETQRVKGSTTPESPKDK